MAASETAEGVDDACGGLEGDRADAGDSMSAFAPWDGPRFKHQQAPAVVTRAKRRTDKADALRDAYAAVDARDGSKCRVTGRTLKAGAPDARVRREHHHLVERSRDKGLIAEPSNIVTVCAEAHALISAGFLVVEGTDASKPHGLRFHWASHVKPSQRILEIRSRRKSAKDPGDTRMPSQWLREEKVK